ncbi:hypothetical protein JHK87_053143 [Glycine soja]|nr:hypothetical protein JHK87_053143 [Glycine soja]
MNLMKAIKRAQAAQKSCGNTHLAIDQLILGILEDSQIRELLKEAGVARLMKLILYFPIFIQTRYPLDLPSGSLGSYCIEFI